MRSLWVLSSHESYTKTKAILESLLDDYKKEMATLDKDSQADLKKAKNRDFVEDANENWKDTLVEAASRHEDHLHDIATLIDEFKAHITRIRTEAEEKWKQSVDKKLEEFPPEEVEGTPAEEPTDAQTG